MRVCHVINNLEIGGCETMLLKLLSNMCDTDIESSVVSLIGKGVIGPRIAQLGVPVDCLGMARGFTSVTAIFRLSRILRLRRPDVVCTWMYQADLLGGLASRLTNPRTPVVWNLRTSLLNSDAYGRTTRLVRRTCANLSPWVPSVILGNSQAVKDTHQKIGYAHGKLRVIPNGFDLTAFAPSRTSYAAVRGELGISPETRLIGMMAQFHPRKDHAAFLQAALVVCERFQDVHFVLCGTDVTSANEALTSVFRDTPHRHRFHLLGSRIDMPRLQASLDIGVLASAPFTEGFPNAVGEAMACGVPCIVTSPGGGPDVVGNCGRIVRAGDVAALAEACGDWLSLPANELAEIGHRSRQRIDDHFSLAAITNQYIALFRELSNQPGNGVASGERCAA